MRNILIFILSILGLAVSVKLSQIYFDANFLHGSTGNFCSINSVVDCNGIAQTKYASFLGIPLAVYGVLFYIAIIGLLFMDKLIAKFNFLKHFEDFTHPLQYIHLMAIFSVFVAITLSFISHFILHKICILCHLTYGINILIFGILAKMSPKESAKIAIHDVKAFAKNSKNKFLFPFLSLALVMIVLAANQTHMMVPSSQQILDRGNVLGDQNSYLKISMYSDYNCNYCAKMNITANKLVENIDGIRIERIEYPIDKKCNPYVKEHGFKTSCQAARYALAAKEQGKYILMSSLLFEHNDNLSEKNILNLAKKHGLDTKKLFEDAHSQKTKDELEKNIQKAAEMGINSTPSTKIGVKIYNYFLSYDELYAIVSEYKNVVR